MFVIAVDRGTAGPFLNVTVEYRASGSSRDGERIRVETSGPETDFSVAGPDALERSSQIVDSHRLRLVAIDCLEIVCPMMNSNRLMDSQALVAGVVQKLNAWLAAHSDISDCGEKPSSYRKVRSLLEDFRGQVTEVRYPLQRHQKP